VTIVDAMQRNYGGSFIYTTLYELDLFPPLDDWMSVNVEKMINIHQTIENVQHNSLRQVYLAIILGKTRYQNTLHSHSVERLHLGLIADLSTSSNLS
jgi:hypothetical protein